MVPIGKVAPFNESDPVKLLTNEIEGEQLPWVIDGFKLLFETVYPEQELLWYEVEIAQFIDDVDSTTVTVAVH